MKEEPVLCNCPLCLYEQVAYNKGGTDFVQLAPLSVQQLAICVYGQGAYNKGATDSVTRTLDNGSNVAFMESLHDIFVPILFRNLATNSYTIFVWVSAYIRHSRLGHKEILFMIWLYSSFFVQTCLLHNRFSTSGCETKRAYQ